MSFKMLVMGVLLTSLFILSGCQCPCGSNAKTCPLPKKVASGTCVIDSAVQ